MLVDTTCDIVKQCTLMLPRWTPNMWIFRLIEVTMAQWRATADADGTPIGDRAHSGHSRWPTGGHSMRRWTGQSEKQICSPILGLCWGASWMSTKCRRDTGHYKQASTWTLYMTSTNQWTNPPKRTLIHWWTSCCGHSQVNYEHFGQ